MANRETLPLIGRKSIDSINGWAVQIHSTKFEKFAALRYRRLKLKQINDVRNAGNSSARGGPIEGHDLGDDLLNSPNARLVRGVGA